MGRRFLVRQTKSNVALEGICLTTTEDICWTAVVTACLRSEVSQAYTGEASFPIGIGGKLMALPRTVRKSNRPW